MTLTIKVIRIKKNKNQEPLEAKFPSEAPDFYNIMLLYITNVIQLI